MRRSIPQVGDVPTQSQAPAKKSRIWYGIASIVVIILVAVGTNLAISYFTGGPSGPARASNLATWQQWGMSISYPSGLKAQFTGALEQQATNSSGEVEWLWNKAQTSLGLVWISAAGYNLQAGFQGIRNKLQSTTTDFAVVGLGNATVAGRSWAYNSYSFKSNGVHCYVSVVLTYYASSQRAYGILFQDTKNDTLNSLTYYGNTFTG